MNEIEVSALAGFVLSLAFSYVPGLKTWYDGQDTIRKRLVMGVVLVVVCLGIYVSSCQGWVMWINCTSDGVSDLVVMLVYAIAANQGTYFISPKSSNVKN